MNIQFQDAIYSSARADVAWMAEDIAIPVPLVETNYGPFFTGNVEAVKFNLIANTQASLNKLDFYADAECTQFMQGHQFAVRNGGSINTSFPVLGAYMMWRITPRVGAYTGTIRLSSGTKGMKPFSGQGQNVLLSTSGNVAAGATATLTIFPTYPGAVVWDVGFTQNDPGNWEAFLDSESESGVVTTIGYAQSAQGRVSRMTYLPCRPCRIRLVNLDGAAAHNYNAYVMGNPDLFG